MRVHEMPLPFDRAPQATPKPADAARLYSAFEAVAALTVDERQKGERERPGQEQSDREQSDREQSDREQSDPRSRQVRAGRREIQVTAGSNAPKPAPSPQLDMLV